MDQPTRTPSDRRQIIKHACFPRGGHPARIHRLANSAPEGIGRWRARGQGVVSEKAGEGGEATGAARRLLWAVKKPPQQQQRRLVVAAVVAAAAAAAASAAATTTIETTIA
ncbi:hypothetical protein L209DRAFT_167884 [Thermothelomyces heterothallicus CBS 203.75]